MLRGLIFSGHVAAVLHARLISMEALRNVLTEDGFTLICRGLLANGYTAERAADLFIRFMGGGRPAFDELYREAGPYGAAVLQVFKEQYDRIDENS